MDYSHESSKTKKLPKGNKKGNDFHRDCRPRFVTYEVTTASKSIIEFFANLQPQFLTPTTKQLFSTRKHKRFTHTGPGKITNFARILRS